MRSPRVRSIIFVLIFGFACTGYLQRQGIGIAAERMMPELGLTQIQVGWLITAFLFAYAVFQVPGALFGQRFGARWTITVTGVLTVIASVLTAAAPLIATAGLMFTTLVLARSLLGVAQGGLFPVASGTIRHWYPVTTWSSMVGLLGCTPVWAGRGNPGTMVRPPGFHVGRTLQRFANLFKVFQRTLAPSDPESPFPSPRPDEVGGLQVLGPD